MLEDKLLMGMSKCPLKREPNKFNSSNQISPSLRIKFIKLAIKECFEFYKEFFKYSHKNINFDNLTKEYTDNIEIAYNLNLFLKGGIPEKDFLLLWCLHKFYRTEKYIESGVFIGSSLFASISSLKNAKIIGIDPNLKNLKLTNDLISKCELIDNKDFSEIDFGDVSKLRSLVFFDDHINAAERIIESHKKGFKFLIFDDASGLEGISERLYPAFPTIPLIMNSNNISTGEEFSWIYNNHKNSSVTLSNKKEKMKYFFKILWNNNSVKVTAKFSDLLLEKCKHAKSLIKKVVILPDMGDFLLPSKPMQSLISQRKYLIQLY
tara:strand:- start:2232 stop:3194 length:963 start_codon:yes stop_codon:yes gene_type:complete